MLVKIKQLRKVEGGMFQSFLDEEEGKGYDGVALCDYRGYLERVYKDIESLKSFDMVYMRGRIEDEYARVAKAFGRRPR